MESRVRSCQELSDRDLVAALEHAASNEREATARLITLLGEFDARRLYLPAGCSSLFSYCTRVLHLSEHAAYGRIEAARASRRCPDIIALLRDGALTLTTVTLLAPHLTTENCDNLLRQASCKSKREVEHLIARLRPVADAPTSIRKLPMRHHDPTPTEPPGYVEQMPEGSGSPVVVRDDATIPEPVVTNAVPLIAPSACAATAHDSSRRTPSAALIQSTAPGRYRMQLTISRDTHDKLRRAQALLRPAVPNGDAAEILGRALTCLVEKLERRRLGSADARVPRTSAASASARSRHIPASVRRQVWTRDGGRCAFVGVAGRCDERGFLEFHHRVPYADGGASSVENLELRCGAHNRDEAELWFGVSTLAE